MLNLHIGGQQIHPDWKILDITPRTGVDFVMNASDLHTFADGSVDKIYASHVLEHFSWGDVSIVLKEWFRVLKPEGTLLLSVPNFQIITQLFNVPECTPDIKNYLVKVVMGGQTDQYDFHKTAFYPELLHSYLGNAGFQHIEYRPGFGIFSDCSEIKVLGHPISLNGIIYKTKPT